MVKPNTAADQTQAIFARFGPFDHSVYTAGVAPEASSLQRQATSQHVSRSAAIRSRALRRSIATLSASLISGDRCLCRSTSYTHDWGVKRGRTASQTPRALQRAS